MTVPSTLIGLAIWFIGSAGLLAAVTGTVVSSEGTPIEHARVGVDGDSVVTFTDVEGSFRLEEVGPPLEITVSHPRFSTQSVSIPAAGEELVVIVLEPKQEYYEEIAVSANRGEENFSPVSVAASVIQPEDSVAPPTDLTEMVSQVPSVSENGQGGLFQTYSIRGVSRQRVLTLVSGMRIVSDRRAGTSGSFVDPLLMGSVDVLRGPSSTYWGSGALGGVVQVFPRRFDDWSVASGYASQGNEWNLAAGWGKGGWSAGVAHRQADDSETPAGETLNSAFKQTSGTVQGSWSSGHYQYDLQAVASAGRDIGKANTDFPERTTIYPEENHLLVRFGMRSEADWSLDAWIHPNDLETHVLESEVSESTVDNSAFDLGLNWQKQIQIGPKVMTRFGLDYFGRRSVDADETTEDLISGEVLRQQTLDSGTEDEAAAYGALEWNWGSTVVLAGGRFTWDRQTNADQPSVTNTAGSGFVGAVVPLGNGFEFVSNAGTGLRFPSLSERFFSGVTGRGEVVGNPNLDPERSLNLDAGLHWYGKSLYLSGYIFHNDISDYIERVEVEPDLLTFVNLTSGTIQGVELEGFYQFNGAWSFSFGGHLIDGENDMNEPLADIPANRAYLGGKWSAGKWMWEGRWEQRAERSDFGSGEKPIPAASLLSMSLAYQVREDLAITLTGRNLLDEEYFNSADRKVALSPGRAIGLALRWTRRP